MTKPVLCSRCNSYSDDLYLCTLNGEDTFICSQCVDEIMDRTEGEQDGTRDTEGH